MQDDTNVGRSGDRPTTVCRETGPQREDWFTNTHTLPLGESGRQARRGESVSPIVSMLNTTKRPHPAATASDLPTGR